MGISERQEADKTKTRMEMYTKQNDHGIHISLPYSLHTHTLSFSRAANGST